MEQTPHSKTLLVDTRAKSREEDRNHEININKEERGRLQIRGKRARKVLTTNQKANQEGNNPLVPAGMLIYLSLSILLLSMRLFSRRNPILSSIHSKLSRLLQESGDMNKNFVDVGFNVLIAKSQEPNEITKTFLKMEGKLSIASFV